MTTTPIRQPDPHTITPASHRAYWVGTYANGYPASHYANGPALRINRIHSALPIGTFADTTEPKP